MLNKGKKRATRGIHQYHGLCAVDYVSLSHNLYCVVDRIQGYDLIVSTVPLGPP